MSGGLFARRGFLPQARRQLFYGVCIWVRLALAVGVGFAARRWPVAVSSAVLAVALVAVASNIVSAVRQGTDAVWWNRPSHAVLAGAIAAAAVLVLAKQIAPAALGVFVGIDVIFGVVMSLTARNFD